jgi:hypothetical protein
MDPIEFGLGKKIPAQARELILSTRVEESVAPKDAAAEIEHEDITNVADFKLYR